MISLLCHTRRGLSKPKHSSDCSWLLRREESILASWDLTFSSKKCTDSVICPTLKTRRIGGHL